MAKISLIEILKNEKLVNKILYSTSKGSKILSEEKIDWLSILDIDFMNDLLWEELSISPLWDIITEYNKEEILIRYLFMRYGGRFVTVFEQILQSNDFIESIIYNEGEIQILFEELDSNGIQLIEKITIPWFHRNMLETYYPNSIDRLYHWYNEAMGGFRIYYG